MSVAAGIREALYERGELEYAGGRVWVSNRTEFLYIILPYLRHFS